MRSNATLIQDLTARFAAMLGEAGHPDERAAAVNDLEFTAELAARGLSDEANGLMEPGTGERMARLAAYLDGGLDESAKQSFEALLAASPAELEEAIVSLAYLDDVKHLGASAPADLVDAASATWEANRTVASPRADIIPLRRGSLDPAGSAASAPSVDSFQLLAAASGADHPAIVCRSQSGLWTLEVFVGMSEQDQDIRQGYLLLSVHPDHRATYEGRAARVFVMIDNEERVLAEEPVRDGEVYAAISLFGLDLWTRDAVNVVFSPDRRTS